MFLLQFLVNFFLFSTALFGIILNRKSVLIVLVCLELMLLSLNLNFILLSIYLDDIYGQLFSLCILTVAAAESSIGLAIIILYYRVRGNIFFVNQPILKY